RLHAVEVRHGEIGEDDVGKELAQRADELLFGVRDLVRDAQARAAQLAQLEVDVERVVLREEQPAPNDRSKCLVNSAHGVFSSGKLPDIGDCFCREKTYPDSLTKCARAVPKEWTNSQIFRDRARRLERRRVTELDQDIDRVEELRARG